MSSSTGYGDSLADSAKDKRDRKRAVIASTIGAIIEWYDFGLYSIAAGLVFPSLFFPHSDVLASTINSFIVFEKSDRLSAPPSRSYPVTLLRGRQSADVRGFGSATTC